MGKIILTRDYAFASGQDAGNMRMRSASRAKWSQEDHDHAASTMNRLLLYVPASQGGLEGFTFTPAMLADLGLTAADIKRSGNMLVGHNGGPRVSVGGRVRMDVLADDGSYQLTFEAGLYKAGCYTFTYDQAIDHWKNRSAPDHDDTCSICKRARLFLKAIKAHAKAEAQP